MAPYRSPLPTFTLALSSLPKQDPFDNRRDFQREFFSGYYASLAARRDFLCTFQPQSLNNCDSEFLPSNVSILEDELKMETHFDDQDGRFPVHSDTGCVTGWWRRIVQMISHRLFRRQVQ